MRNISAATVYGFVAVDAVAQGDTHDCRNDQRRRVACRHLVHVVEDRLDSKAAKCE
jgi:hypothetical protein